jgi:5,10-methylenetetrahydrofolate reductase
MARDLPTALRTRPLFLEPVPPSARTSPARAEAHLHELASLVATLPRVDALDIPELVDENHDGRPYYRSGDTRVFARQAARLTGREIVVNKVVAHLRDVPALEAWAAESVGHGLHHFVLVGGSSRYIPYPGPSVAEADRVVRPIAGGAQGLVGNIAIPQRTGEAHRMLQKTRAGAAFFTTQIVFDSESVLRMVREYDLLCRQAGVAPATVLLSVAPIADEGDAEFVRWLGADIPEPAERAILNGDEAGAGPRSIDRALAVWHGVLNGTARHRVEVPVGVNVEQISIRHLGIAGEMARAFSARIDAAAEPSG